MAFHDIFLIAFTNLGQWKNGHDILHNNTVLYNVKKCIIPAKQIGPFHMLWIMGVMKNAVKWMSTVLAGSTNIDRRPGRKVQSCQHQPRKVYTIGNEKCCQHPPLHFTWSTLISRKVQWLASTEKSAVWSTVDVDHCSFFGRLQAALFFTP